MPTHPRGSARGNQHSATGVEMLTYTRKMVPLDAFQPHHADPVDIAYHLAGLARYGGAHPVRITVAQHSVAVMVLVRALEPAASARFLRAALLHDAAEAYTNDLIGAVKLIIREREQGRACACSYAGDAETVASFDKLGDDIQAAIEERFDAQPHGHDLILRADKMACAYEMRLGGWHPVDVDPLCSMFGAPFCSPYTSYDGGEEAFYLAMRATGCLR